MHGAHIDEQGGPVTIAMNGVLVLVASPGDAADERAAVSDGLLDWNITRGRREQVALLPWLWEKHAVPRVGGRPQAIVNAQAVDQADVVVAFFDSRLGTSTGVDVSGTAEEINRAVDMGKPVHVYFSDEPLSRDVDEEQLRALREFQEGLQERGILGRYSDPSDLVGQVIRAIEADIDEAGWANAPAALATPPAGARLSWEHVHEREARGMDSKGRMKYSTTQNHLVVRNDGTVAAEDLTFELSGVGGTEFVFPDAPDGPVTVHPLSTMSWLLIPASGLGSSGNTVAISGTWSEDGAPREANWTITLR